MRQIIWNKFARKDYYDNIDYLLTRWSEKEAQNFIDEVDEIEFILKQGEIDYQVTDMPGIRRCVLRPQITLFYKIIDNQHIELLRFWNNHQDIEKLSF
ncbi:MAG TPA: type II toxin-antitoxin system RelE/ParE family toxin [Bacteroidales bacterium]